jgi:hypothetical protein
MTVNNTITKELTSEIVSTSNAKTIYDDVGKDVIDLQEQIYANLDDQRKKEKHLNVLYDELRDAVVVEAEANGETISPLQSVDALNNQESPSSSGSQNQSSDAKNDYDSVKAQISETETRKELLNMQLDQAETEDQKKNLRAQIAEREAELVELNDTYYLIILQASINDSEDEGLTKDDLSQDDLKTLDELLKDGVTAEQKINDINKAQDDRQKANEGQSSFWDIALDAISEAWLAFTAPFRLEDIYGGIANMKPPAKYIVETNPRSVSAVNSEIAAERDALATLSLEYSILLDKLNSLERKADETTVTTTNTESGTITIRKVVDERLGNL